MTSGLPASTPPAPPSALELAWLALLPAAEADLTSDERSRVERIRAGAAGGLMQLSLGADAVARVQSRCDALLGT